MFLIFWAVFKTLYFLHNSHLTHNAFNNEDFNLTTEQQKDILDVY